MRGARQDGHVSAVQWRTIHVLALVALLAGCGLVAFDDLVALTTRTGHGDKHHLDLLRERTPVWHTDYQSANLKHYPVDFNAP
jgi:hypothetical protein